MQIVKLRQHKDERGMLVENTLPEIMKQSNHFFVSKSQPGVVRGNHYHTHKSEWFYVIQGTCEIIVEDMNTKKRETVTIRSEDENIFHMEPGKAHAFKNIGKDELIVLALINDVFDPENPDTVPYKIL